MRRLFFTLLVIAAVAAAAHYWGQRPNSDDGREQTTTLVERPSPSVVMHVRSLARLEGSEFHIERVIDLREKQSRFYGLIQPEDALLLVAVGDVVAGVDLSRLIEADVEVSADQKSVLLLLPPAEIFSARLDSSRTYVHSRQTDILAERKDDLETKARAQAEESLRTAALEGQILVKAEDSVRRSLSLLLSSLGFRHVQVTFRAAPSQERSFNQ